MTVTFTPATKTQARLRMALIGPSGSGKTYTALAVATKLGERVAVIDTEHGSASKYAGIFSFDTLALSSFRPAKYIEAIHAAEESNYDVVVVDSLSHEWDAVMEMVDEEKSRLKTTNSFMAWKTVTPQHNALLEAILQSSAHVIATMRTKTEYLVEQNEKGQMVPRKIGTTPKQRDGAEYEFDVTADLDMENTLVVAKTRCPELAGAVIKKPGEELAATLRGWLTDGVVAPPKVSESKETKQLSTPEGEAAGKATNDQLTEIANISSALDRGGVLSDSAFLHGLETAYGVTIPQGLTVEQADDLIARLKAKYKQAADGDESKFKAPEGAAA